METSSTPAVSDKHAFLAQDSKLVTVNGLTCRIRKLKAGEVLDINEGDASEQAQALKLFALAVIEPVFTEDEFMQLDVDVYMGVAELVTEFCGLGEVAASAARKSADSERGRELAVPVLGGE